ncbi:DUF4136 domain-containing protein [Anaeromyxobacter soli]|uniref:DUF4136 domain-containing protein n=1 Tax=Anaeromyxobacter soli TaxID=2922725 RepID=UPI001FB01642|nr:DUF4136 domain-containing protein [Anaeromyxobacter sp. SG29]
MLASGPRFQVLRHVTMGALLLVVAGCNGALLAGGRSSYYATVQAFHRLAPESRFQFAFLPIRDQEDSLEYATYQDIVRSKLCARGWTEVAPERAEVVVAFDYLIDDGKPYSVQIPVFGQTGVRSATTNGYVNSFGGFSATTTYSPQFGIVGFASRSYTVFTHRLYVMVFENSSGVNGKLRPLFQATAASEGRSQHLSPVMPFLISAVFLDFPGESGAINNFHSRE